MKHLKKYASWKASTLLLLALFLVFAISSCAGDGTAGGPGATDSHSSQSNGVNDHLCDNVPYPLPCLSGIRRYQYMNDANKFSYFYEFSANSTTPILEIVVQGSVFNVSSLNNQPNYQEPCNTGGSGACAVVLEKRQPDGTYGTNGNAIYGWDASGAYFEWNGIYEVSQRRIIYPGAKVFTVGCKQDLKVDGCQ